ncbi:MAG: FAD-binding protein, partial [Coriobacteriales bacterium]|nr:FAD-binding protein [Coriobacteriales bacterium]
MKKQNLGVFEVSEISKVSEVSEASETSGLSRRSFLKGAGLGMLGVAGAGALVSCSPNETSGDGAGTGTGGGNAAASSNGTTAAWRIAPEPIAAASITATEECDVLILGLGNAGAAAMRAAAEAGAVVYAFHDTSEGSLTFRGGGQFGHINSAYLASQGVPKVDVAEFVNDWQVRSNNRSNPGLIRNYAKHCGDAFDWYIEPEQNPPTKIGCWKPGYDGPAMRNYGGIKSWVGTVYVDNQADAGKKAIQTAVDKGGKVFWETPAVQLVTNSSGTVTGAIGESPEGYLQVNASKGVIICTGGYGANQAMAEDILWEIMNNKTDDDTVSVMMDSDGKGIAMAVWIGGRLDPCTGTMDGAYWYPCDQPTDFLGACASLWINANGERYCNEGLGSTELMAMPGVKQPSGKIYTVFGNNVADLLKAQPFGHMTWDFVNGDFDSVKTTLEAALAAGAAGYAPAMDMGGGEGGAPPADDGEGAPTDGDGGAPAGDSGAGAPADGGEGGGGMEGVYAGFETVNIYGANDLATLAGYLGYAGEAADTFVRNIERYNELCDKGVDEDFGKDKELLVKLEPPYYAYGGTKKVGSIMLTVSGLQIDENGAVLGPDWQPIPGLYAAGNASGCRFGWQ